jgi:ribosomal protein S18 acetylase RimI-like enzyme
MTTPGTEMGASGNTADTGATGRSGELGGPGGGERELTIGRLDGAQIDLLEPLWRSLIDHIRELGSVVSLVPHEQSWPRRRAIYEELFADGESFALGAWRGEQLVGYAMVHIAPPDAVWFTGSRYAELTSLCLAPAERGDGLGTKLLDAVEAGLLERGLDEYVIGVDSVNDGARRFYERRGFRDGFHLMHGWIGGVRSDVDGGVRAGDADAAAGAVVVVAAAAAATPTAAAAGSDEDLETPETASLGID